jgi:hypothetical protein
MSPGQIAVDLARTSYHGCLYELNTQMKHLALEDERDEQHLLPAVQEADLCSKVDNVHLVRYPGMPASQYDVHKLNMWRTVAGLAPFHFMQTHDKIRWKPGPMPPQARGRQLLQEGLAGLSLDDDDNDALRALLMRAHSMHTVALLPDRDLFKKTCQYTTSSHDEGIIDAYLERANALRYAE